MLAMNLLATSCTIALPKVLDHSLEDRAISMKHVFNIWTCPTLDTINNGPLHVAQHYVSFLPEIPQSTLGVLVIPPYILLHCRQSVCLPA